MLSNSILHPFTFVSNMVKFFCYVSLSRRADWRIPMRLLANALGPARVASLHCAPCSHHVAAFLDSLALKRNSCGISNPALTESRLIFFGSQSSPPNAFIGSPVRNSPGFPLKACGNDDCGKAINHHLRLPLSGMASTLKFRVSCSESQVPPLPARNPRYETQDQSGSARGAQS